MLKPRHPLRFEDLLQDHLDSVYRFLRYLTGSASEAEDLTQETFIEAGRALRRFRGESSVRTWLHRIAYRRYQKWLSSQRPTAELPLDQPDVPGDTDFRVDLDRALADLTEDQRVVFVLAEIEMLDLVEIAETLGIPLGTVKSRLSRAKVALRTSLEEPEYEPVYP